MSFINMCLAYNSNKRPSWNELLTHKFFKNEDLLPNLN
jgi:serine/threonine protein kinase